ATITGGKRSFLEVGNVGVLVQAQKHLRARFVGDDIVCLVLCEWLSELAANIVEPWMDLAGEIRPAHRVKIIEADRKITSIASCDRDSQHSFSFGPEQVIEGAFQRA